MSPPALLVDHGLPAERQPLGVSRRRSRLVPRTSLFFSARRTVGLKERTVAGIN